MNRAVIPKIRQLTVEDYPGITDAERYPYATPEQIAMGKQIARSMLKFVREHPEQVEHYRTAPEATVKSLLQRV